MCLSSLPPFPLCSFNMTCQPSSFGGALFMPPLSPLSSVSVCLVVAGSVAVRSAASGRGPGSRVPGPEAAAAARDGAAQRLPEQDQDADRGTA